MSFIALSCLCSDGWRDGVVARMCWMADRMWGAGCNTSRRRARRRDRRVRAVAAGWCLIVCVMQSTLWKLYWHEGVAAETANGSGTLLFRGLEYASNSSTFRGINVCRIPSKFRPLHSSTSLPPPPLLGIWAVLKQSLPSLLGSP